MPRTMTEPPGQTWGNPITDLISKSLSGYAEWDDANLYMPYSKDQVLLPESGDCIAVQTFLRMVGLPFTIRQRPNTDFISPNGKVPVLKVGKVLVAEFVGIVDFVHQKGIKLSSHLGPEMEARMHAHIAVLEQLKFVETYVTWLHADTYSAVTRHRVGSVFHWPLSSIVPYLKRREVVAYLSDHDWAEKSIDDVAAAADKVFRSLSLLLGTNPYMMGEKPTELDALAFGHFFAIMTTTLPYCEIQNAAKRYTNLLDYVQRIEREVFKS